MIVYIDNDFICHADNIDKRRAVNAPLDGVCSLKIETYRFIPNGESWTDADGRTYNGETLFPAADPRPFDIAQQQYEEDESTYLAEIGVLIEEIYNEDLEVIG